MDKSNPLLQDGMLPPPPRADTETAPPSDVSMVKEGGNPLLSAEGNLPPEPRAADFAPVDMGEDIKKTLISKGTRGAVALPGMFGDIPAIFGADKYRPPTTEEYIEKLSSISPEIRTALEYKPKTTPARYVGSAAEFLPTALIPAGGLGLGMRAVGAAGSGLASEGASDVTKKFAPQATGTPYEGAARLAGAVVGGMAAPFGAGKIAGIINPESVAAQQIAKKMAADAATRNAAVPISEAISQEIAPVAAAGPQTKKLVSVAGARAGEGDVGAFNAAAQNFKDQALDTVHSKIDSMFGTVVKPFEEKDILTQRVKDLNDVNYTRVMALPEAQVVQDPALSSIANRIPPSLVRDMVDQFKIKGVSPASLGIVKTPAGYQIPAQGGSLRLWDTLKQQIDSEIGSYKDAVTKTTKPGFESKVRDLQGLKSDMINVLDNAVPEYGNIRYAASDIYGSRNAIEAGYKYYKDINPQNQRNIENLVTQKLTGPQRDQFAYGFAGAYKDALATNPEAALGVFRGGKGDFRADKMRFALGDQRANDLLGTVNAQYLNSSIRALQNAGGQAPGKLSGAGTAGMFGGFGAVLGAGVANILDWSAAAALGTSGATLGAAATAGAAKYLYNAREIAVANKVLKLVSDPANNAKLGKLIAEDQYAKSFLAKFYSAMKAVPAVAQQTQADKPVPRQPLARKSGGRVSDQLIRAVDRAKKNINKGTEVLLNTPDSHVAHALEVANRNLEG